MSEELQLRVESKMLDMSLDDLRDVAVKLRIENSLEKLSKMAVIRAIRVNVETNLGQDEETNIEYLEALIKMLARNPQALEGSSSKEDCECDADRTKEEFEKRKSLVQQARKEYEAVEKLLKEKETLLKEAQDSLQEMTFGIPQIKPLGSTNAYEGKPPVNQSIHTLCNLLRIKDSKISAGISNNETIILEII